MHAIPESFMEEVRAAAQVDGPRLELLRLAAAVIDGIPDDRVNLSVVHNNEQSTRDMANPHHCGTIGCAMGWLSMHPAFNAIGLKVLPRSKYGNLRYKGKADDYDEVAKRLFNLDRDDVHMLFSPVGCSLFSRELRRTTDMNDKQIFRERVREVLKKHARADSQG